MNPCGWDWSVWTAAVLLFWFLIAVVVPVWGLWSCGRAGTVVVLVVGGLAALQWWTIGWPAYVWTPDTPDTLCAACKSGIGGEWLWRFGWWECAPWLWLDAYTKSLMGERLVGAYCHGALVCVVAGWTRQRNGWRAAVIAAVLVATHPPFLWLSRHFVGLDLIVVQLVLIAMLESRRWWTVVASAVIQVLCCLTYSAMLILLAYPLVWSRWRKAAAVYSMAAAALLVMSFRFVPPVLEGFVLDAHAGWQRDNCAPFTNRDDKGAVRSLTSLAVPGDGVNSTPGIPGSQTFPITTLIASAAAVGTAPEWVGLGLLSLLPDALGCGHGRSHRQMFAHLPLLIGATLVLARLGTLGLVLTAVVAADGVHQWLGMIAAHPEKAHLALSAPLPCQKLRP